jgi:hypothetical protein
MKSPRAAAPAGASVLIKIEKPENCWKLLADLIAKRAAAIRQRRAETREDGTEIWRLAEAQVERPLCCGMLKLTEGWLVSFDSAEMGTAEIDVCVEPHRLVLLGRSPSIGGVGCKDCVVRVLKLPNEVNPANVTVRHEGPIVDIELKDATRGPFPVAAKAA